MRLCVVTRAPTADGQKTGLLQPSSPSPPPGLCVPMLGGFQAVQGRGILATMGEMVATVRFSFQGSRPSQLRDQRPGSGPPRGAAGAVGWTLHCRTYWGILSGDAVSHGYGLATVSGERAWLCPQFPPLPEWLHPPPARGRPVSRPWADRAPWGPQSNQGSWAQQGAAPGAGTRRGVPI